MNQLGSRGGRPLISFGPFRLEPDRRRLWRDGQLVPVYPKAVEALAVLVEHAGEILPRERLIKELWPDTIVEDSNLTVAISHLRKVLAENGGEAEEFIQTIPRVGYRFISPTTEVVASLAGASNGHNNGSHPAIEEAPLSRTIEPTRINPEARTPFRLKAKWLGALAAAAVVLGAVVAIRVFSVDGAIGASSVTSVAVLPLRTPAGTANDDYLAEGLAEGLIHSLSRLQGLRVISRRSAFAFKNREADAPEIGQRLGVMAVVEGSVEKKENATRVRLRLVSTKNGEVLWATETVEQPGNDLFELEDRLIQSVSAVLRPQLSQHSVAQLTRGQTEIAAAYEAYLKGRYFWSKRTFDDMKKSIVFFNQAIAEDPSYALAYAGLADAYALLNYYGGSPPGEVYPKAKQAAQRALELDENLAEAHASLAYVMQAYDWDWAGAEREYRRAIEINPNYATAHFWYGELLSLLGRFEDGISEIQRAAELDPLSPIISASLGWAFHMGRQEDRAIAQLQKALELDAHYAMTHFYLGMAYEGKGMYPEAIAAYQKSRELSPLGPGLVGLGHVYAMSGRRDEALEILKQLQERVARHEARPTSVAIVAAGLNDPDTTFAWLDQAREQRAEGVLYLKEQPYYDNIRSDPRRIAFLRRIGVEE